MGSAAACLAIHGQRRYSALAIMRKIEPEEKAAAIFYIMPWIGLGLLDTAREKAPACPPTLHSSRERSLPGTGPSSVSPSWRPETSKFSPKYLAHIRLL
jgi:hypothetical protein